MARLTYTLLQAELPDNTTGLILPDDVRSIVESYSMMKNIGTFSGSVGPISTVTPTIVPVVQGAAVPTPNMSINGSNQVVCGLAARYVCEYKVTGLSSAAGDLLLQLYVNGSAIDYSQVYVSAVNAKYVTLEGSFIISTFSLGVNAVVDMRIFSLSGTPTLSSVKAFLSVTSLPVQLQ